MTKNQELEPPIGISFDWYRATAKSEGGTRDTVVNVFTRLGFTPVAEKPHFKGFKHGMSMYDGHVEIGHLAWGGANAAHVLFEVHGHHTMRVVSELRASCPTHKPSRLDVAIDFDFDSSFETLLADVMDVKRQYKLFGEPRGDWADFPELGRTFNLGKRTSPGVLARLYEKGRQEEWLHADRPTWSRLEFQIHPDSHNAHLYASVSPIEALAARRWAADLGGRVLQHKVARLPVVVRKADKTPAQTIEWIGRNYWRTLVKCKAELGSWEQLGAILGRHAAAANQHYFTHTKGG